MNKCRKYMSCWKIFFLTQVCIILSSCIDNIESLNIDSSNLKNKEYPIVTEEGFLSFPSFESLEIFLMQFQNDSNSKIDAFSRSITNFESIAMLDNRLSNKSRSTSEDDLSDDDLAELEEMTQDEYNLMKAENLLFDNLLFHAMDTTLRICVDGCLYKVTTYGTFSARLEAVNQLDSAIGRFDPNNINKCPPGGSIQLTENVMFTNSFGNITEADGELLEYTTGAPLTRTPTPENDSKNEFHKNYGVDSYKWKNTNIFKNFLDFIRGKDVSKSKNFSKNYRVKVNIFDVNYAFYKSAGVKVKMQKRKKFCGIPYWKEIEAQKIVIGFNEMEGELKYDVPNNMATINPPASANWRQFTATFDNLVAYCIYGAYHDLKFIKDWTDDIIGWMPQLEIGNNNYTENILNKIYNMPADYIYKQSKQLVNKTIYQPIVRQIKPTDPVVAYLIWGVNSFQFDKEHPYITGVKEYESKKSKSVIFDRSFGVAFHGYVPAPYTPSDFNIKSIDAFGGAYYDNQWLGVRFYGK